MSGHYDVIVIGGGLVGAAAAIALAEQKLRVALVDRIAPEDCSLSDERWDSRIYAISPGNADWLTGFGVWDKLSAERICPITQMQIWGDAQKAPLVFDAYAANVGKLGLVSENGPLQQACWQRMQQVGVSLHTGAACTDLSLEAGQALLSLGDGSEYTAKLIVGADGANSWVRTQVGIPCQVHDYRQTAVVANFATELPHRQTAFQWFRPDGVLAWLPLPGQRMSMVWSTNDAKRLLDMDAASLAQEVAMAGQQRLGNLSLLTAARGFALNMHTANEIVRPRLVLIGDAAHQIHPLAGQGVNLGFRDAVALAETLDGRQPYQDIGDYFMLRRYARARKSDMLGMRWLTHGLHLLYDTQQPLIRHLRDMGLQLTERQALLKRRLIRHAIV